MLQEDKKDALELFLIEIAVLKDALREMKNLSLLFQHDGPSVVNAMAQMKITQEKLLALKLTEGRIVGEEICI